MLSDFSALKDFFKIDAIKSDTNIFRFHYKLTVIFLVTFATIISLYDLFLFKKPFPLSEILNYLFQ